jgi:hypothetical protein
VADPRVRAKKFLIQPKNIDGENVGKSIVYTWEQLKEIYSDKASKHDLDTPKGYRAFKKAALKELNKKHSPEYQKRLDRETHAKRRADFPEEVRAQEKLQGERNPATKLAKNAAYRARKLAAITGEYYIPAFRSELDEIYRAASLFPDQFDVDHIKRLAGNLEELGGKHEPRNLQLLKKKLHGLKTALENSGNFEDAARVGAFNEYNLAPNVRGLLAENVLGKKGLMNFMGDAYQKIKPGLKFAGKTALRAVPIAGAGVSIAQANEYRKAGQDKLAAMAALSASQGPWGLAGLAGEMGGLLWNKATKRKRFPEGQQGWRQSLLDPNHPGLGGG